MAGTAKKRVDRWILGGAILTLLLDIAKGALAVWLADRFLNGSTVWMSSAAILVVLAAGTYSYFARSVEAFGAISTAVPNEFYSERVVAESGFAVEVLVAR